MMNKHCNNFMVENKSDMKSGSNLEKLLRSGQFAVTAELGPPRGADRSVIEKRPQY